MTVNKVGKVIAGMEALTHRDVLVGIPSSAKERNDGDPINNAAIGYIMENGSPEANIPARPWLVPGVRLALPKVIAYFKAAAKHALAGNKAGMDTAFNAAGLYAVNVVRRHLQTGPFLPLAPRTLAARRARGRTGTKPLIDTAQMRNAVTYVLVK